MDSEKIAKGITEAILEFLKENRGSFVDWLKEQKINVLPHDFNVAISIIYEKKSISEQYYNQILKEFKNLIDSNNLTGHINIKEISQNFINKGEAESFRNKEGFDLLIWGSFSADGLKEQGKITNKIDLNFTFGHPENELKQIGPMVIKDINSRFYVYNYWKINEEDSLRDIGIISSNAFDISLYIIALTFKLWGRFDESILMFEKLYQVLDNKNLTLRNQLAPHLINCYEQFAIFLIIEKRDIKRGIMVCEKIIQLDSYNIFALLNLARLFYETGEVDRSFDIAKKLLEYYPRNAAVELDIAFHKIMKKEYKSAFRHYERLISISQDQLNFNPIEVIEFLDKQFEITKEPALLYASGLISFHYGDPQIAEQSFNSFLNIIRESFCKEMYRSAKNKVHD